jgi:hypothetical protein
MTDDNTSQYPPPPPPPGQQWQPAAGAYPQPIGSGVHVTAIICGIFGVIFGLIPLTFILAWGFGLVALVVGIMAYRRAKKVGVKQGRAGIVMGVIAIALGIVGVVVINDVFEDVDDDLTCLEEADTPAEIEACGE